MPRVKTKVFSSGRGNSQTLLREGRRDQEHPRQLEGTAGRGMGAAAGNIAWGLETNEVNFAQKGIRNKIPNNPVIPASSPTGLCFQALLSNLSQCSLNHTCFLEEL